jgi:predicted RNase H-like HicB family nuclease
MNGMTTRPSLNYYLDLSYPLTVTPDPDGGYVIAFPDLPGCLTQIEELSELATAADEIRTLWIETEYERGREIPRPSYPEEYSGKFNVRLPRSLHRKLVESAEREGVSLNHYVSTCLARGDAQISLEHRLGRLEGKVDRIKDRLEHDPAPRFLRSSDASKAPDGAD